MKPWACIWMSTNGTLGVLEFATEREAAAQAVIERLAPGTARVWIAKRLEGRAVRGMHDAPAPAA